MLSFWSPLALAVAFWRISHAFGGGISKLSDWNRFCLCCWVKADSPAERDSVVKDSGKAQVRNRRNWELIGPLERLTHSLNRRSVVHEVGTIEPLHIVSVGHCRPHHLFSNDILDIPGFKVSTVLDSQDLDTAIRGVPALVLAHDSLHPRELEAART